MENEHCWNCNRSIQDREAHVINGQVLCEDCYVRTTGNGPAGPVTSKARDALDMTVQIDESNHQETGHEKTLASKEIDLLEKIVDNLEEEQKKKKAKEAQEAVATLIALVIVSILVIWGYRSCSRIEDASDEIQRRTRESFRVEGVRLDKRVSNAWGVCGLVRNLTDHSIKGHVEIDFLDSSGKSYFSTVAMVKNPNHQRFLERDWIEPGDTGAFEYWDDPKAFSGVADFRITFQKSD